MVVSTLACDRPKAKWPRKVLSESSVGGQSAPNFTDADNDGLTDAEEREIDPGHGLAGIAERARGCGGRSTWGFRPGHGFELEVWMPPAARQP